MPINSRTKGKTAEREFIGELKELLGPELTSELTRNLDQTRDGGHDINGLAGWAPEIKRYAKLLASDKKKFWEQTITQATAINQKPVLAYREDRAGWRAVMRLSDVLGHEHPDWCNDYDYTVEMSLESFCYLVREGANVQAS
jgi:hypothetical protein